MDNVKQIKSITIDCGDRIKLEIMSKDKTIQSNEFEVTDTERYNALRDFIHFNNLDRKVKVNFNGTHHDT